MNSEVSLGNKKLFKLFIGKRILKEEVFNRKDGIPAYSANVLEPFGYIDKSNILDFSKDYIIWGIDGKFQLNIIEKGKKFATTDHCGSIEILNKEILPEYLFYQLDIQTHLLGFDRSLRSSLTNMEKVSIKIPIAKDGSFDLNLQKSLVESFRKIYQIKKRIFELYNEISNTKILFEESDKNKIKTICLGEEKYFFIDNGERIRKKDIDKAKGKIPVYSSSQFENEALGYVSDNIIEIIPRAKKFKGKCITINADGSVGKVFLRNEEFYANDILNILEIKDKNILYEYILYELQNKLSLLGLSWINKLYKEKLRKVCVDIPIDKDGQIDTKTQKDIANKYDLIYNLRNQVALELKDLDKSRIEI